MSKIVDYIEKLGEGGKKGAGEFTLGPKRAREKMQEFQLAAPHRYVLELAQAAVAPGATTAAGE